MRKKVVYLMFLVLLVLAAYLGYMLTMKKQGVSPDYPFGIKKKMVELFGIPLNDTDKESNGEDGSGLNSRNFYPGLPTNFGNPSRMTGSSYIQTSAFDRDGLERVVIRGVLVSVKDAPLTGTLLGRKIVEVESGGEVYKIFLGKTVRAECINSNFYDKNGKKHDLKSVFVDYDEHVDNAELKKTQDIFEDL
jgi:hypothetical protein